MGAQFPERSRPGAAIKAPAVWARSDTLASMTVSKVNPTLCIRFLFFRRCAGGHVLHLLLIFGVHGFGSAHSSGERDVILIRPFVQERILAGQVVGHGAALAVAELFDVGAGI